MIRYIVVHCSDSPSGRGDGAGTIHRWHTERGWAGIGYHYVITEDGEVAPGRPVFTDTKTVWPGAHVRGHNRDSIGICLIGKHDFTEEQAHALSEQLDWLKCFFRDAEVVGHYQLDPHKTCPNFDVPYFLRHGRFKSVSDED